MKEVLVLNKIRETFLSEEIDYLALSQAVASYKELLQSLSQIDLDTTANRQNIEDNGIAVGTTWAALCLDDMRRTRTFVRGIAAALADLKKQKGSPIQVIYAGTGPYATLILPLLPLYTAQDIQLTLIEINRGSFDLVQKIFAKLGFEKYVRKMVCANAINYQVEKEPSIDLIISETMQNGLRNEHQVPIMLNLLRQVGEKVVIIPEGIQLDLAAVKSSNMGYDPNYENLGEILEISKASLLAAMNTAVTQPMFPEKVLNIDLKKLTDYHTIAILTSIKVYQKEQLDFNQSGLTIPHRLKDIADFKNSAVIAETQYKIKPIPNLHWVWIDN